MSVYSIWESRFPAESAEEGVKVTKAIWRDMLCFDGYLSHELIQDLDQPVAVGSFWGEVNANVHKALGAIGTITRGGVRDLDEMRHTGFKAFASAVLVSHAYVHIEEFGGPVQIGRLTVQPGDLVHADQHGTLVVPAEIARDLPRVVLEIERLEREIIDCARSAEFTPARLAEVWNGVVRRWPKGVVRPQGAPEVP